MLADVRKLAASETRSLGNWSQGQICKHLADTLDISIDGTKLMPAPMRFSLSLFFKNKFLNKSIPPGFSTTSNMVPKPTTTEDGVAALEKALARQRTTTERAPHPGFGKITREERDPFHLRHAEMHLSFIVPKAKAQGPWSLVAGP
jgi:hypothetical protein